MKNTKRLFFLLAILLCVPKLYGQNIPIYTLYYVNPYIYNPAYAGIEGRPSAALTYRKQWYGVNDAPVTANFIFHTPVAAGVNFGLNATDDKYGIFRSSSLLLTLGYTATLGYNHYLSLGVSGGAGFQRIDYNNINDSDPAYLGIYDNNTYLDGGAGIAYHVANLNIGFSLPKIFNTNIYPGKNFDSGTLGLIKNYIVTADYMIYFGNDDFAFQPYGIYRSYEGFEPEIEGGGIFHLKNLIWVGGAYRKDFGIAGMAGLKLKGKFSFAYSYELPILTGQELTSTGVNMSSHEIQLSASFGKRRKIRKKYATFLASAKPVKEKEEKKEIVKKEEPVEEEPIEETEPVVEEPQEPAIKEPEEPVKEEPKIEEKQDVVIVPPIVEKEPEVVEKPVEVPPIVEPEPEPEPEPVPEPEPEPIVEKKPEKSYDKTAVVVKRGKHPFELESGHYVVLGVFGIYNNAVRLSDKLRGQGYNTTYGYSSEKKLFYVVIRYADDPKEARKKRDELRKIQEFKNAWYLVVE